MIHRNKLGKFLDDLQSRPDFSDFYKKIKKSQRKGAVSRNPIHIRMVKKEGRLFAEEFQRILAKNMAPYDKYSIVNYEVDIDGEGYPLVTISLNSEENYSPSLYPSEYPDVLMPRLLDTGFEIGDGKKPASGLWVSKEKWVTGLRERAGMGFIQETIDEIYSLYGIEVELRDDFYEDYDSDYD